MSTKLEDIEIEDVDFGAMLEDSFKKQRSAISKATIVDIQDDVILVDVGAKSEGKLKKEEMLDAEGNLTCKVGDELDVVTVTNTQNGPIVSHKKAKQAAKTKEFLESFDGDMDKVYEVSVATTNKGGAIVVENESNAEFFIPRSQLAFKDTKNMPKKFKVLITNVDKEANSITASRKKYIIQRKENEKQVIEKVLNEKDPIPGVIKKITSYGMFVDVGGVDGLVHYKEISYKGSVNPKALFSEGDTVNVVPISFDKDKRHLSLSIKAAMPNPWKEVEDVLDVGDAIKVTVSNIEPYGVFVDLGNDIEGFLHISEINWDKNLKDPATVLNIDDEIDVEVIEIDTEKEKLRVSLKNLQPKPFDEFKSSYKVDDIVKGLVSNITDFGSFIKIGNIDGLLHNNDFSWDQNQKCKDCLKEGEELEVKIIKIDNDAQKITLSKKVLEDSPAIKFGKDHSQNSIVTSKIKDIKDFGVFIELTDNLDGLIKNQDLGKISKEEIKLGDEIEAVVVSVDGLRNKVQLSHKKLDRIKEKEELQKFNASGDENLSMLGDALKAFQ
jgi:small subunit ribosomal protein S1